MNITYCNFDLTIEVFNIHQRVDGIRSAAIGDCTPDEPESLDYEIVEMEYCGKMSDFAYYADMFDEDELYEQILAEVF